MAQKPKPFIFRIRHETQANRATVWLIRTDGAAVERITFEGTRHDEPRPETVEAEQKDLFSAME